MKLVHTTKFLLFGGNIKQEFFYLAPKNSKILYKGDSPEQMYQFYVQVDLDYSNSFPQFWQNIYIYHIKYTSV